MHAIEAEIKIPGGADPWRKRLEAVGFVFALERPRHFEDNRLFDTPDRTLSAARSALRIRSVHGAGVVTFKGVPHADAPPNVKVREEVETVVEDPETLATIFERLGLRPTFRYQKYRTTYRIKNISLGVELHAMFDETPLGDFLELEGDPSALLKVVAVLKLAPDEYLSKSYPSLQAERCRQLGKPLEDMLFPETTE
jgi:adenylate cyclase class 2